MKKTHTDNCGRTGAASVQSCKLDCACWCHVPVKKTPLALAQEIVAGGNGQAHSYEELFRNAKAVSEAFIEIETAGQTPTERVAAHFRNTSPEQVVRNAKALTARAHIIATDEDVRIKIKRGTETPESMGPYAFGPTGSDLQQILEACGVHVTYTYKG